MKTRRNILLFIMLLAGMLLIVLLRRGATVEPPAKAAALRVRGITLAHVHRGDFGYGSQACREQLTAIARLGANWVAINDFAYMDDVGKPGVSYSRDGSMREEHLTRVIRDARAAGLQVLMKPHLWARSFGRGGKWHGDIRMSSEANWDAWFENYGQYVLYNAEIAQAAGAEALSIGVEYVGTVEQDRRWRELIAKVRKVFHGKLTYSANFDEYSKIRWWDGLDCIGINAYFPLSETPNASDDELRSGWKRVYSEMAPIAGRFGKPICFTELGYTASATAGKAPYAQEVTDSSPEYQARLYRVALEEAAKRDFVHGVFVWKWFSAESSRPVERQDPFSVQSRPLVIGVLRTAFNAPTGNPETLPAQKTPDSVDSSIR